MELYVPKTDLQRVSDLLTAEGVAFETTGKTFTLAVAGKETSEVVEVKVALVETEVPAIFDEAPPRNLRAYRLPSGRKFIFTDLEGNFDRIVEPPPGWER